MKAEELKQESGKAADSAQQNASQAADKAGTAVEDGKQKASGTALEIDPQGTASEKPLCSTKLTLRLSPS